MLVFAYGFRAPVRVTDSKSLKAVINSAKGEITLCEKASLERDEGAGREYYAFSYPRLIITKHFGGYTVAFCKKAWDDERVASGGEKLSKSLMLECAEQFMVLLSDPDFEAEEKLPSCVEWE